MPFAWKLHFPTIKHFFTIIKLFNLEFFPPESLKDLPLKASVEVRDVFF